MQSAATNRFLEYLSMAVVLSAGCAHVNPNPDDDLANKLVIETTGQFIGSTVLCEH